MQVLMLQFRTPKFHNTMDMIAFYGGFAANLMGRGDPVWVMNAVPTFAPNTLTIEGSLESFVTAKFSYGSSNAYY
jgi:hypothetical protein